VLARQAVVPQRKRVVEDVFENGTGGGDDA
jgi:hypothetical protein